MDLLGFFSFFFIFFRPFAAQCFYLVGPVPPSFEEGVAEIDIERLNLETAISEHLRVVENGKFDFATPEGYRDVRICGVWVPRNVEVLLRVLMSPVLRHSPLHSISAFQASVLRHFSFFKHVIRLEPNGATFNTIVDLLTNNVASIRRARQLFKPSRNWPTYLDNVAAYTSLWQSVSNIFSVHVNAVSNNIQLQYEKYPHLFYRDDEGNVLMYKFRLVLDHFKCRRLASLLGQFGLERLPVSDAFIERLEQQVNFVDKSRWARRYFYTLKDSPRLANLPRLQEPLSLNDLIREDSRRIAVATIKFMPIFLAGLLRAHGIPALSCLRRQQRFFRAIPFASFTSKALWRLINVAKQSASSLASPLDQKQNQHHNVQDKNQIEELLYESSWKYNSYWGIRNDSLYNRHVELHFDVLDVEAADFYFEPEGFLRDFLTRKSGPFDLSKGSRILHALAKGKTPRRRPFYIQKTQSRAVHDLVDIVMEQFESLSHESQAIIGAKSKCTLALFYLFGVADHKGNLELPYGWPRNHAFALDLITLGIGSSCGLCNSLLGFLAAIGHPLVAGNLHAWEVAKTSSEPVVYQMFLPRHVNGGNTSSDGDGGGGGDLGLGLGPLGSFGGAQTSGRRDSAAKDSRGSGAESLRTLHEPSNLPFTDPETSGESARAPGTSGETKGKMDDTTRAGETKEDPRFSFQDGRDAYDTLLLSYLSGVYKQDDSASLAYANYIYTGMGQPNRLLGPLSSTTGINRSPDAVGQRCLEAIPYAIEAARSAMKTRIEDVNYETSSSEYKSRRYADFVKKLSTLGDADGLRVMGDFYYVGHEAGGIEADIDTALHYWRMAADRGDVASALTIANHYISMANSAGRVGGSLPGAHESSRGSGTSSRGSGAEPLNASMESDLPFISSGISGESGGAQTASGHTDGYAQTASGHASATAGDNHLQMAQHYLRMVTEGGNPVAAATARYYLARYGLGEPRDPVAAARWLRESADRGDLNSQLLMAHAYAGIVSDIVPEEGKNIFLALDYYKRAAKTDSMVAKFNTAVLTLHGYNQSYTSAADRCNASYKMFAQVGRMALVPRVVEKIAHRAKAGNDEVGQVLAHMFLSELGNSKSNEELAKLFYFKTPKSDVLRSLCFPDVSGNPISSCHLWYARRSGHDAEQGSPLVYAQALLSGNPWDPSAALTWAYKATDDIRGKFLVGTMLEVGLGTSQDCQGAWDIYMTLLNSIDAKERLLGLFCVARMQAMSLLAPVPWLYQALSRLVYDKYAATATSGYYGSVGQEPGGGGGSVFVPCKGVDLAGGAFGSKTPTLVSICFALVLIFSSIVYIKINAS